MLAPKHPPFEGTTAMGPTCCGIQRRGGAMRALWLRNIQRAQPEGTGARSIWYREKRCDVCFLRALYFYMYFFPFNWRLELAKSLNRGDRRESRSSSYLCHHSYWSDLRWEWANNSKQRQARDDETKVVKSPDAWFGFKRCRWLGAVPETPFGHNL